MRPSRKREQPISSSSDVRSSGGPAAKHVNKRRRLELHQRGTPHGPALAERSPNIVSSSESRALPDEQFRKDSKGGIGSVPQPAPDAVSGACNMLPLSLRFCYPPIRTINPRSGLPSDSS